jgi:hypothetical protein
MEKVERGTVIFLILQGFAVVSGSMAGIAAGKYLNKS